MSLEPELTLSFAVPDLKKRYDADWALVTGSGSGIGRSICFKLASQGLNVVLVSIDDQHLAKTVKELRERYPKQQFRSVYVLDNHPCAA